MKKIGYKDLQLEIEISLSESITKNLKPIINKDSSAQKKKYLEDKHYFELIKHAVEIQNHFAADAIIKRIEENLDLKKVELKLFIYQDSTFNVNCFPKKTSNNKTQLQIFISQHFFNNLNEDEQVGIIGHEIAHHLFNHLQFPAHEIIHSPLKYTDTADLKSDLIYHSKVSEISADIIGLIANDFNYRAYSTALIKHLSGLNDSANSTFSISPLIEIVLQQYENYSNNLFFNDIYSTHPLMPVRVKIINTVVSSKLVKHFGQEIPDKYYYSYKKSYNKSINDIINSVYPEIYPNNKSFNNVLIPMSVAVMLADNIIDVHEISLIKTMIGKTHRDFKELDSILNRDIKKEDYLVKKQHLVRLSIRMAKQNSFNKRLIVPIIRKLIIVAASDGEIEKSELNCIYLFAKEFNISRMDIIQLIKTQYKV